MNKLIITQTCYRDHLLKAAIYMKDQIPVEMFLLQEDEERILGNIYVAQVENVSANIHAVFLLYAPGKRCYLPLKEWKNAIRADGRKNDYPAAGDQVLIQISKEALKTKLPCASCVLNIAGKYLVVTSETEGNGYSQKLSSADKSRLKKWVEEAGEIPNTLIVRTNSGTASKEEFLSEIHLLSKLMQDLLTFGVKRTCFTLLYEAENEVRTFVRDIGKQNLDEILTDLPEVYEDLKHYFAVMNDSSIHSLRFYTDSSYPLDKLYRFEKHLTDVLNKKVWLDSGAFLVIEQTEAFVCIDVNTGKNEERKKPQEMFRRVNLEAAKEIAHQIRLRNLSGTILIDFINLTSKDHQDELLNVFGSYLKKDRIKTQIIDLTALQITEVTRKKVRGSFSENFYKKYKY